MTPSSLSVPTDNIYKFACLFGLALIVSSVFALVVTYTSSLDRKVRYSEIAIPLEAKSPRTKAEDDVLAMYRHLIEVTKSNEYVVSLAVGVLLAVGLILSGYGAKRWHSEIQKRDDKLASLQVEKLEAEVAKLRADLAMPLPTTPSTESKDNEGNPSIEGNTSGLRLPAAPFIKHQTPVSEEVDQLQCVSGAQP
jgi:hypothetical protein